MIGIHVYTIYRWGDGGKCRVSKLNRISIKSCVKTSCVYRCYNGRDSVYNWVGNRSYVYAIDKLMKINSIGIRGSINIFHFSWTKKYLNKCFTMQFPIDLMNLARMYGKGDNERIYNPTKKFHTLKYQSSLVLSLNLHFKAWTCSLFRSSQT